MSASLRVHSGMTVFQLKQLVKLRDGLPLHRCELRVVRVAEKPEGDLMDAPAATLASYSIVKEQPTIRVDVSLAPDNLTPPESPGPEHASVAVNWSTVPEADAFILSVGYSFKPIDESGLLHITEIDTNAAGKEDEMVPTVMMADVLKRRFPKQLEGQTLDGYRLLDGCGVDLPEEVCRAVMTSFDPVFNGIFPEHMLEFTNLTFLDLSGNNMPVEKLDCFPALQELHLSCNALHRVFFERPPEFHNLQVLDLSYNFLSVDSVKELSAIPSLSDLNLAGNDFPALPPDLSGFHMLRKLSLRRNRLGQQYQPLPIIPPSLISARHNGKLVGLNTEAILVMTLDYIFLAALATIPLLEELDLSENHLQAIPPGLPRGFKRLKFLNVSYNFIDDERKIIPVIELPSVEWLDVRGNLFNMETVHKRIPEYPYLYRTLCEGRGIKIVINQPKPSFLHDESHILRAVPPRPAPAPRVLSAPQVRRIRQSGALEGGGRAILDNQNRTSAGAARPRLKRVTNTDELAAIFGVEPSTGPALTHHGNQIPPSLYDDDDDTFLTGQVNEHDYKTSTMTKESPPSKKDRGFAASKATSALGYVLSNPLMPTVNSNAHYEQLTASMAERKQPRRNYVVNRRVTDDRCRARGPKIAEVYSKMERVLDALDGNGSGSSGLTYNGGDEDNPPTKQAMLQSDRARARRDAERQEKDMSNLLSTVSRNFRSLDFESKPVFG